jgi:hypothetical protein
MTEADKPVGDKVADWLLKEGYPLEFQVANHFRAAGFVTNQGAFARSKKMDAPREIDVSASVSSQIGASLVRVYHLVECKWTQDKPWVVFTDSASLHPNALVAQTISSKVGHSALWVTAPDRNLHKLDHFTARERNGFNGRQAFSQSPDQFYSAVQSIIEKSVAVAEFYDEYDSEPHKQMLCAVVFPVVVISGLLFEASFNKDTKKVELREADRIRVQWNGAGSWNLHAIVDIVKESALPDYCTSRFRDTEILVQSLSKTIRVFQECFDKRSMKPLDVLPGPRGVVGTPYVLKKIREHAARSLVTRKVRSRGVDT